MSEEQFLTEIGADITEIALSEEPEEEIIYNWDGELFNEQAE